MIPKRVRFLLAISGLTISLAVPGRAALLDLGPGSFTPAASVIEFDEVSLGTVNPVFNFTGVPGIGNITVSFGGTFLGQSATPGFPVSISGSPSSPLTLNAGTPTVYTEQDGASDSNPVLSGNPTFNGPISVFFSTPVAGVGLKGGFFNAIGGTTIEAYDFTGASLGSIVNSTEGFEFYGLADSSGNAVISGISFYITGDEPAGFAIDNLTFGAAEVIRPPQVPDGGSTALLLSMVLSGLAFVRSRRH